jgi:hypothetical protein
MMVAASLRDESRVHRTANYRRVKKLQEIHTARSWAKASLDAAWRVDPQPSAFRYLLAGLIAFSLEQFEDMKRGILKAASRVLQCSKIARGGEYGEPLKALPNAVHLADGWHLMGIRGWSEPN